MLIIPVVIFDLDKNPNIIRNVLIFFSSKKYFFPDFLKRSGNIRNLAFLRAKCRHSSPGCQGFFFTIGVNPGGRDSWSWPLPGVLRSIQLPGLFILGHIEVEIKVRHMGALRELVPGRRRCV